MDVVRGFEALPLPGGSSVATIGVFDGVHLGHRAVVERTRTVAAERSLRAVAVTFDRHPRETLTPGREPPLITTLDRKLAQIADLGLDVAVVLPFDEELAHRETDWFVDHILVEGLRARHVVVGANFTFGHLGAGTVATLEEAGSRGGFTAEGVALVELSGRTVSSSSIRAAAAEGDLAWPRAALGRRFAVDGRVVRGAGRGGGLGFPTANLEPAPKMLLPGRGIYAGRAMVGGGSFVAAIDVGTNPTFGWELLHVEAFLLDFEGDLSGREISIEFWERLRDEVRFESVEALIAQMADDVARTRAILSEEDPEGTMA